MSSSRAGAPQARRYTFPPSHRLKRTRLIRSLFDRSRDDVATVAVGALRALFRRVDRSQTGHDTPLQIGFSPGPGVRSGVARNRVRRLMREVYRRHQHAVLEVQRPRADALLVMLLFRGDPATADTAIPRDLPRVLDRLVATLHP
ncbi:ribonuclease P protein component [Salisaeta longa]|uniref:ribonuclease P protein component n=1 Tax=Salisaeta longa TaxID=503170 RepID=UPI0003B787EE|nr:ribonuclease P protein component [Salisaeta longa]